MINLYPHQEAAYRWAISTNRAKLGLFLVQRWGKTPFSMKLISEYWQCKTCLIVDAEKHWSKWQEWADKTNVKVTFRTYRKLATEKYSFLSSLAQFDCLIIDEAHRLWSALSQQTRAMIWCCNEIKHVLLLTGTPYKTEECENLFGYWIALNKDTFDRAVYYKPKLTIWNYPSWYPAGPRFSGQRNDQLKTVKNAFLKHFFQMGFNYIGRWSTLGFYSGDRKAQFFDALKKCVINLSELPNKPILETVVIPCSSDDKERFLKEIAYNPEIPNPLVRANKAKDFFCRLQSKIDWLKTNIELPCLVFADVPEALHNAHRQLNLNGAVFTGATSKTKRDQMIADFQAGKLDVLYISTAAGGEGIDLYHAKKVYFLTYHWAWISNAQAFHRALQWDKEVKTVITLSTDHQIEKDIYELIINKKIGAANIEGMWSHYLKRYE